MDVSGTADALRVRPRACGQPISDAIVDQAAQWLTLLMSGEATEKDRQRWQQWRTAHPDHERAWQHIETVTGRLKVMEHRAAYQALSPFAETEAPRSPSRRKAIGMLVWGGVAGTTGLLATRTRTWQQAAADYRTSTGEQRSVMLVDGTRITLNTGSALNVRFDGRQRLVRLLAGEVLVATGHATNDGSPDARAFVVETAEGRIRALGTRFTVRQRDGHTHVAVLESAVEIAPRDTASPRVLHAGEQISFTRETLDALLAADDQAAAWSRGQIVADNVRLGDFLADLGRYRAGIVRCDPALADLRFSGVFPVHDTDRILATLPNVLPVQVKLRTRYWVTVEAAR